MKLIGTYLSPFARRVAAALISLGIPYEHDDLNGYLDPVRARQLNPVGKVPVLVLDDGEHLIDSGAILDHIDELAGPGRALAPRNGRDRRAVLRLSAIATAVYEQSSARYFEDRRPSGTALSELIDRYRLQTIGGLEALNAAAGRDGPIGPESLNIATISGIVAFDYTRLTHPDLDPARLAPALATVAAALADEPAFAKTRPQPT